MENRNLQRQKKEQQRKAALCYRRQKEKEVSGRKRKYKRKILCADKKCLASGSC